MAEKKTLSLKTLESYIQREKLSPSIEKDPLSDTSLFIVIPVFQEESLVLTLQSLARVKRPQNACELILVFNSPANHAEAIAINEREKEKVITWYAKQRELPFVLRIMERNDLDPKVAGVGLARKIGMDEALLRAFQLGLPNAPIICLDADCTVNESYLVEIEEWFADNTEDAVVLHFEHPLEGTDYSDSIYHSITLYELHLRYYKRAMNYVGLLYDRYTVGSSMAVRANAYAREGGMNKKKAGEDFYFLQKYLINQSVGELFAAVVYPSPRKSERVPFGTGRAMLDHEEERKDLLYSYSFQSFELIKELLDKIEASYPALPVLGEEWDSFLKHGEWESLWSGFVQHSHDWKSFQKRFYQWFTPFRILKLIHFLRDEYYPNTPLVEEAQALFGIEEQNPKVLLKKIREWELSSES